MGDRDSTRPRALVASAWPITYLVASVWPITRPASSFSRFISTPDSSALSFFIGMPVHCATTCGEFTGGSGEFTSGSGEFAGGSGEFTGGSGELAGVHTAW